MRLATMNTAAGPRPAALVGDRFVDLVAADPALPPSVRRLIADPALMAAAGAAAARPNAPSVPAATARLLAPIPDPQKVVCVGLNYRDHAAESHMPIPREPVLFSKFPSALIGHGEPIVVPAVSTKVDYEGELVIIVGKAGRRIPEAQALDHVAGYSIGHDVSARDWQLEKDGKQWMVGKTFDTFAPVGPTLVTRDEVPNPHKLGIRLRLNGKTMQDSNTEQMIFSVAQLVTYLSVVLTLEPGDLIFTGTPPGIGHALRPPVYLKPGDVAEVEIDTLGVLRNRVVGE
jgi:2-keto-4-pentenoate hydratase/2-oxohepta-3-ene-1,7-dioic acid hydratase in catechol pathway